MVTVQAIRCPNCLDIIFSRAVHDYHSCSCGSTDDGAGDRGISVDGGFSYLRYGWANTIDKDDIEHLELNLNITKEELYQDWNYQTNKYGVIKNYADALFIHDWFWRNVVDLDMYNLYIKIGNDTNNKNEILEQLYCETVYA